MTATTHQLEEQIFGVKTTLLLPFLFDSILVCTSTTVATVVGEANDVDVTKRKFFSKRFSGTSNSSKVTNRAVDVIGQAGEVSTFLSTAKRDSSRFWMTSLLNHVLL
jgi:hypothetical protein